MKPPRPVAAVLLAALLACAGTALATVATAAPSLAATARPHTLSVTLYLAPADRAGLDKLASSKNLDRATRAARLAKLRPSAAARAAVVRKVRALGLTVRRTTRWSVTASGPAQRVTTAFGSARENNAGSHFAHALPRRPGVLAKYVTAIVGGDETRPARRPLLSGSAIRAAAAPALATAAAAATPAAVSGPPYDGQEMRALYNQSTDGSPGGGTIATLQFDVWNPTDLTTYAASNGLTLAPGQYTAVSIDGRPLSGPPDTSMGATEVALDQETLLGVSPHSNQRAYFAPNTAQGSLDMLHQVAADAIDTAHNYYGLVALSTSWGLCEAQAQQAGTLQAEQDALEEILASGVTIFAATGDSGAYDCQTGWGGTPTAAVDFPASSPAVIAVGGTTRPATGPETGWIGSGGGVSQVFARPSYQSGFAPGRGNHRLVPDIAANADPSTGFYVVSQGSWLTVGGTSFAAPAMAAMFVNELGGDISRGRGDIHSLLYRAPYAFRDITSGGNTLYPAVSGYDLSTGLGAPIWSKLGPIVAPRPLWVTRSYTGAWGSASSRPAPSAWGGR